MVLVQGLVHEPVYQPPWKIRITRQQFACQHLAPSGGGELLCSGQTTRLSPRRTGFDLRLGVPRITACCNHAGRCRSSTGFLEDIPFSSLFHSGVAPYSSRCTLVGFEDPNVIRSRPILFTRSFIWTRIAMFGLKTFDSKTGGYSGTLSQNEKHLLRECDSDRESGHGRSLPLTRALSSQVGTAESTLCDAKSDRESILPANWDTALLDSTVMPGCIHSRLAPVSPRINCDSVWGGVLLGTLEAPAYSLDETLVTVEDPDAPVSGYIFVHRNLEGIELSIIPEKNMKDFVELCYRKHASSISTAIHREFSQFLHQGVRKVDVGKYVQS
ncbi:hypothetical protein PR048_031796 [Dryococelus australis]|uniref:Uncharacterized protein n=1 Tax=Dryococelus australis TaxID=614101 RepID=A0ABQ9G937_9NEOP|nr:hypothetical protein PR048_031796 [Dryococelus australis]